MPGMLDNVMRRVWSSLTAAGQHIGQLKIYLKYDEEQAPDLSEWHKKNKDKGRKTGSELCANEREWAEEFYNGKTTYRLACMFHILWAEMQRRYHGKIQLYRLCFRDR